MTWLNEATVITAADKAAQAAEQARLQAKDICNEALNSLTYTFADGREIQVRPQDLRGNIKDALDISAAAGLLTHEWILADNSVADVTTAELQEAMQAGYTQAHAIMSEYTKAVKAL